MYKLKKDYTVLIQKVYLCNITCLNNILYRKLWIIFDQEYLAKFFDIKVHPRYKECFEVDLKTTEKLNDDEWLKTIQEEDLINKFFAEHNIALKAKSYKLSEINNLSNFIIKNLQEDNDMWVEYKIEWIWQDSQWIHDWLIESFDLKNIVMINPWAYSKNRFLLSLEKLEEALSDKFARETGIVVIK